MTFGLCVLSWGFDSVGVAVARSGPGLTLTGHRRGVWDIFSLIFCQLRC